MKLIAESGEDYTLPNRSEEKANLENIWWKCPETVRGGQCRRALDIRPARIKQAIILSFIAKVRSMKSEQ